MHTCTSPRLCSLLILSLSPSFSLSLSLSLSPLTPPSSSYLLPENVSQLLRQMFEQHQASNPVEDLVKGAAGGDVGRVDQLLASEACGIDDKFSGRTALHAASQNGHYDVVRCLVRYNANVEEEVRQ